MREFAWATRSLSAAGRRAVPCQLLPTQKVKKVRSKGPTSELLGLGDNGDASGDGPAAGMDVDGPTAAELLKPKAPVLKSIAPDANFVDDDDLQLALARTRRMAARMQTERLDEIAELGARLPLPCRPPPPARPQRSHRLLA